MRTQNDLQSTSIELLLEERHVYINIDVLRCSTTSLLCFQRKTMCEYLWRKATYFLMGADTLKLDQRSTSDQLSMTQPYSTDSSTATRVRRVRRLVRRVRRVRRLVRRVRRRVRRVRVRVRGHRRRHRGHRRPGRSHRRRHRGHRRPGRSHRRRHRGHRRPGRGNGSSSSSNRKILCQVEGRTRTKIRGIALFTRGCATRIRRTSCVHCSNCLFSD